jgi:hypothetical protein
MVKTTKQESSKRPNILYNNNKVIRIKDNNKEAKVGEEEKKAELFKFYESYKEDEELIGWCNSYSDGVKRRRIVSAEFHEELRRMDDYTEDKKRKHVRPMRFAKNWLQGRLDKYQELVGAQEKSKYKIL